MRVLLATHNGAEWLAEQLRSIVEQRGVQVSVVASDDASTDETRDLLARAAPTLPLRQLPTANDRLGSANRNFLRLIRDTPIEDAQYFALSDQDDIWFPDKLDRAVHELNRTGAAAYSSNVTAFWDDGRERLLVKSCPQRRFDYLFESAGPGCTFVFEREAFVKLQAWTTENFESLQALRVHDWLIYAHARKQGWHWHIDDRSGLRYRQHTHNEMGANVGWRAALTRWQRIRSGDFRSDVLAIATAVGDRSPVTFALRRLSLLDRLRLVGLARQCRRRVREALILALLVLLLPGPRTLDRQR